MPLCSLSVKELLVYMYLSQLMSTFTKLSKSALSSQWFLHPGCQVTSDPTITHVYTYTLVCQIRIHKEDCIPVICFPVMLLSSNMGLSKCESTLSHLNPGRNVCLSVLLNLDFNILPVVSYFDFSV